MKKNAIIIEGARNVGKSFFFDKMASHCNQYKLPFVPYFKEFLQGSDADTGQSNGLAYQFSLGADVAFLELVKSGALTGVMADRGFISNVVLGEMQGRVKREDALRYLSWLNTQGYLDNVRVVYIYGGPVNDTRNKDEWEFLAKEAQYAAFDFYLGWLEANTNLEIVRFENSFDERSLADFVPLISGLARS